MRNKTYRITKKKPIRNSHGSTQHVDTTPKDVIDLTIPEKYNKVIIDLTCLRTLDTIIDLTFPEKPNEIIDLTGSEEVTELDGVDVINLDDEVEEFMDFDEDKKFINLGEPLHIPANTSTEQQHDNTLPAEIKEIIWKIVLANSFTTKGFINEIENSSNYLACQVIEDCIFTITEFGIKFQLIGNSHLLIRNNSFSIFEKSPIIEHNSNESGKLVNFMISNGIKAKLITVNPYAKIKQNYTLPDFLECFDKVKVDSYFILYNRMSDFSNSITILNLGHSYKQYSHILNALPRLTVLTIFVSIKHQLSLSKELELWCKSMNSVNTKKQLKIKAYYFNDLDRANYHQFIICVLDIFHELRQVPNFALSINFQHSMKTKFNNHKTFIRQKTFSIDNRQDLTKLLAYPLKNGCFFKGVNSKSLEMGSEMGEYLYGSIFLLPYMVKNLMNLCISHTSLNEIFWKGLPRNLRSLKLIYCKFLPKFIELPERIAEFSIMTNDFKFPVVNGAKRKSFSKLILEVAETTIGSDEMIVESIKEFLGSLPKNNFNFWFKFNGPYDFLKFLPLNKLVPTLKSLTISTSTTSLSYNFDLLPRELRYFEFHSISTINFIGEIPKLLNSLKLNLKNFQKSSEEFEKQYLGERGSTLAFLDINNFAPRPTKLTDFGFSEV